MKCSPFALNSWHRICESEVMEGVAATMRRCAQGWGADGGGKAPAVGRHHRKAMQVGRMGVVVMGVRVCEQEEWAE